MADEKNIYLNLQQQVGKNKHDIEELRMVKFNLERAGVRVVGEEASASDLPDPITYTGQLGDAYLIGSEPPYDMYIYTQPSVGETNFKWFNIGHFPAQGPQGEVGPEGPAGPQGDASNWRFGSVNPSILDTDRVHDGYLNTTTGMVYEFSGTNWIPIGSIKGPQDIQGPQGPKGDPGAIGPRGETGATGPAGMAVTIIGTVASSGALPDPGDVDRHAAYIVDDGNTKELYVIIGESDNLSWYNAGEFTGTPGDAAGFGTVSATTTTVDPEDPAEVTVATSGPNTAKNISFSFKIPQGAELQNTDSPDSGSATKGYTQDVIRKRTLQRVIKDLSEINLSAPVTTQQIIAALQGSLKNTMLLVSNDTNFERISDAPKATGQLIITEGTAARNFDVRFIDDSYNVFIYHGAMGTPSAAVWVRLLTSADAAGVGTPVGGTTGQILAKKSDDDFDTEWEDVPNAPNGVPDGGAQGHMLIKKTSADYDTEWVTPPTGVPDGGSTGQMLVKQSNADGDAAWQTPPAGLPASGTTGQILQKNSGANFDVEWAAKPVGIPSGGTTGQVLAKSSGADYAVEWATPAGGGGANVIFYPKNLLINPKFRINERDFDNGSVAYSSTGKYTRDRWYIDNLDSGGTSYLSLDSSIGRATIRKLRLSQFIAPELISDYLLYNNSVPYLVFVCQTNEKNAAGAARNPIKMHRKGTAGSESGDVTPIASGIISLTASVDQYYAVYRPENIDPSYIRYILDFSDSTVQINVEQVGAFFIKYWNDDVRDAIFGANTTDPDAENDGKGLFMPYDGDPVEREKCFYYFEKANQRNIKIETTAFSSNGSSFTNISITVYVTAKKKRINPTKTGEVKIAYYIKSSTGEQIYQIGNASFSTVYAKTVFSASGFFNGEGMGAKYSLSSLKLDAEIYPS